jgi:threonine dehydrogenase-like Zn-dependent dehydrogenase
MMECTAFLIERDGSMRVGARSLSGPAEDEAVLQVEWAGLCGSDLHVMRNGEWVTQWPATLGHEIYGRVERLCGDGGSGLLAGQAVVVDSRIACGACDGCRTHPDRCIRPQFVGEACPGGFATHCVLPTRLLHPVPEGMDGSTAVLAEPLAVAVHAIGHLRGDLDRIAIVGHGPLGALIHIELRRRHPQATIDVAEPVPLRAELGRALGAETVPRSDDLSPESYGAVVDAAGYRASLTDSLALARVGAQVLVVALGDRPVPVRPMALVERRLSIIGSNAFVDELPQAIALLAEEPWRYEPLVTDTVALRDLPEAAARQLRAPDAVKMLVRP